MLPLYLGITGGDQRRTEETLPIPPYNSPPSIHQAPPRPLAKMKESGQGQGQGQVVTSVYIFEPPTSRCLFDLFSLVSA